MLAVPAGSAAYVVWVLCSRLAAWYKSRPSRLRRFEIDSVRRPLSDPGVDSSPAHRRSVPTAVAAWADWIVESLKRDYEFHYCAVLIPTPDRNVLRLVGQRWGTGEDPEDVPLGETLVPVDASVCGAVLLAGTPTIVSDVRQIDHYRAIPGTAMRSELAVPIVLDGRTIGVINVESPRVAAFDIADLHRLVARAAEAAMIAPLEDLAAD
jgi:signal transduction protein with GAF and PtsI domain